MSIISINNGSFFDFNDPENIRCDIDSIAWSLAHQCRFNGHVDRFYSVAQHSVLVSTIVPSQNAMAALLHDSAEAFMGDIVKPLKDMFPVISEYEEIIRAAIFRRFGLDEELPDIVKWADLSILSTEKRDLLSFLPDTDEAREIWKGVDQIKPQDFKIRPMDPIPAYQIFLYRFTWLSEHA